MPLKAIIQDFCAHTGININDPIQKNFALTIINAAAEDLYTCDDPANCLREQLFMFDTTAPTNVRQLTLPYYVGNIRAVRQFNAGLQIQLHDMRPRYATGGWHEQFGPEYLTWRFKGFTPLQRDIINEGPINFVSPVANDINFNITITGGNDQRSRFLETVNFPVGATSVSTTNAFSAGRVESIQKDIPTSYDISVTDVNDLELAVIPNSEILTKYQIFQISDFEPIYIGNNQYTEVLYKLRFTPFKNDTDEFPSLGYDKAIYWKSLEHYFSRKEGKENLALLAHQKCTEVMENIGNDSEAGIEKEIDFGQNQYLNMFPRSPYRFFKHHLER